jgi:hypothetical protein
VEVLWPSERCFTVGMQGALLVLLASGLVAIHGTGAAFAGSTAENALGWGESLDVGDVFGGIRSILTWTSHR